VYKRKNFGMTIFKTSIHQFH